MIHSTHVRLLKEAFIIAGKGNDMNMSQNFLVLLYLLSFGMADFSNYNRVLRSDQCQQECAVCGDEYSCATSCSMCANPDCKCASLSMEVITIPNKYGVYEIWADTGLTLDDCNYACSVTEGCVSYSYRESLKRCELYDETPTGNLILVDSDGVTLYVRKCFTCEGITQ